VLAGGQVGVRFTCCGTSRCEVIRQYRSNLCHRSRFLAPRLRLCIDAMFRFFPAMSDVAGRTQDRPDGPREIRFWILGDFVHNAVFTTKIGAVIHPGFTVPNVHRSLSISSVSHRSLPGFTSKDTRAHTTGKHAIPLGIYVGVRLQIWGTFWVDVYRNKRLRQHGC